MGTEDPDFPNAKALLDGQWVALGYLAYTLEEWFVIASPLPAKVHPIYEYLQATRRDGDLIAHFPKAGCVYLISNDGAVYGALPETAWA